MDMSPVIKTSITDGNGLSNGVFFHLFSQNYEPTAYLKAGKPI